MQSLRNLFSRNTRTEKHVPAARAALVSNTNVPMADGQVGPSFAQGAQGSVGLQCVDVVLSSAQILALLGTPVTLVPAPPTGYMIVPFFIKIIFFGGSIAYTNAAGAVNVKVGATLLQALTEQFTTTVSPNRTVGWIAFAGAAELQTSAANPPDADGAAMTINKITNNYAAGNGTAKITVYYSIEPTT